MWLPDGGWVCVRDPARSPSFCTSLELVGEQEVRLDRFALCLGVLPWEYLGSIWDGQRNGVSPVRGCLGAQMCCLSSGPASHLSVKLEGESVTGVAGGDRPPPGDSGGEEERVHVCGGGLLPWAFGSHRLETTSFCSWPVEELMR